jgi:hypothetical protein
MILPRMENRKLDTCSIGLDVGLSFCKWLTGRETLHYGDWMRLAVSAANLGPAQEAYTDRLFILLLVRGCKQRRATLTRRVLTDAQWAIIEPFCLGKTTDPGQTGGDPRLFIEAVLWIVRTGASYPANSAIGTRCSSASGVG